MKEFNYDLPIKERTEWHEYTTIERCQETGKPTKVYSLDVERALIWDAMTPQEGQRLQRYEYLCKKHNVGVWEGKDFVKGLQSEEKQEWLDSCEWCIDNDLDLSIIPKQLRVWW